VSLTLRGNQIVTLSDTFNFHTLKYIGEIETVSVLESGPKPETEISWQCPYTMIFDCSYNFFLKQSNDLLYVICVEVEFKNCKHCANRLAI
jgi:hypothetical protein